MSSTEKLKIRYNENMHTNISDEFNKKQYADIIITLQDQGNPDITLYLHKIIVCTQSKYFSGLHEFYSKEVINSNVVLVSNCLIAKKVIKSMYTYWHEIHINKLNYCLRYLELCDFFCTRDKPLVIIPSLKLNTNNLEDYVTFCEISNPDTRYLLYDTLADYCRNSDEFYRLEEKLQNKIIDMMSTHKEIVISTDESFCFMNPSPVWINNKHNKIKFTHKNYIIITTSYFISINTHTEKTFYLTRRSPNIFFADENDNIYVCFHKYGICRINLLDMVPTSDSCYAQNISDYLFFETEELEYVHGFFSNGNLYIVVNTNDTKHKDMYSVIKFGTELEFVQFIPKKYSGIVMLQPNLIFFDSQKNISTMCLQTGEVKKYNCCKPCYIYDNAINLAFVGKNKIVAVYSSKLCVYLFDSTAKNNCIFTHDFSPMTVTSSQLYGNIFIVLGHMKDSTCYSKFAICVDKVYHIHTITLANIQTSRLHTFAMSGRISELLKEKNGRQNI